MGRFTLGEGSYGSIKVIGQSGHVHVGKYCSIADHVSVIMLGHNPQNISTFPFNKLPEYEKFCSSVHHPVKYGDVLIGNDVWLGYNATIMGGLKIGSGSIVAAESMVTNNVPAYSIVGGNPSRIIKLRFPIDVIIKLLEIKWWDWPRDKIIENAELLCSPNIVEFLSRYSK